MSTCAHYTTISRDYFRVPEPNISKLVTETLFVPVLELLSGSPSIGLEDPEGSSAFSSVLWRGCNLASHVDEVWWLSVGLECRSIR